MPISPRRFPLLASLTIIAFCAATPALSCTILVTEGQGRILVGNNEDDTPASPAISGFARVDQSDMSYGATMPSDPKAA
jgi:hypothetical protein